MAALDTVLTTKRRLQLRVRAFTAQEVAVQLSAFEPVYIEHVSPNEGSISGELRIYSTFVCSVACHMDIWNSDKCYVSHYCIVLLLAIVKSKPIRRSANRRLF